MPLDLDPLFAFFGLNVQGDLGGITFYETVRRGLVAFVKAPPHTLPSPLQLVMRNRFRNVGELWQTQPEEHRDEWMAIADAGNLRIHGYNLFTYYHLTDDLAAIETLIDQTGLELHV